MDRIIAQTEIITEVYMLASQLAIPNEGHLEWIYNIYAYFNINHNSRLVFDPLYPPFDMRRLKKM